ncbi:MAG: porin [Pseudomonadota bacterium]
MSEKPQAPTAAPAPVPPSESLAGFSDGTPFLRSPDRSFVLFPGARLQTDAYVFRSADKTPNNTFLLRSARLELGGWVGSWVYFFLTGEFAQAPPPAAAPVAPANLLTNDDYVAIAPWGNLAVLQVGQFDAPFTLENRVSSKFIPFMERSVTVRAFGIPDNKEMGAMIHGFDADRNFYYSVGTFNGDGQNFKNADGHFDWMGRV